MEAGEQRNDGAREPMYAEETPARRFSSSDLPD